MLKTYVRAMDAIRHFGEEQSGQDTFEYLLVIGGISVAIIAAVALATPGLITGVIGGTCSAINTVLPASAAITC